MNPTDFPQTANRQLVLNSIKATKLVNHYQILFIEADDNYSRVYLDDETEFLLSKTLGVVEAEMNDAMFFRCHRAYLINILYIREISKGNDMCITLKNGSIIPLAKKRLCELRKLIAEKM